MAITNYTELQAAVANWCHRTGDDDFEALLPDFIALAETRFNRELRVSDMEETLATTSLSSGEASLPAGFLAFKELRFDGTQDYTLQPKSLEWIRAQDDTSTGDPRFFAVTKSTVVCWPPSGSVKGTYYEAIPPLADNDTNWLLDANPDLYLFAALTEAAIWMQDDSRLPIWADRAAALLAAVQRQDDRDLFDGGILATRAR